MPWKASSVMEKRLRFGGGAAARIRGMEDVVLGRSRVRTEMMRPDHQDAVRCLPHGRVNSPPAPDAAAEPAG
jgi:hypothetical protein